MPPLTLFRQITDTTDITDIMVVTDTKQRDAHERGYDPSDMDAYDEDLLWPDDPELLGIPSLPPVMYEAWRSAE